MTSTPREWKSTTWRDRLLWSDKEWKKLMKGELGEITSIYKHIKNYKVLNKLNENYSQKSNNILRDFRKKSHETFETFKSLLTGS